MQMKKILKQIENEIQSIFHLESSGHDFFHLKRVCNLALTIQKQEKGDREIIAAAALLHDIHRIMQYESGTYVSPKDSLTRVQEILDRTDFPEKKKNRVFHCVEYHEDYHFSERGNRVHDIETLILQDADNLDALGAIGIGRTFTFGGTYQVPMWLPDKPLDITSYDESIKDPSVVHHFYNKLFRLKDNMNTVTGRKMAERRHQFMKRFINEFLAEWDGKK
jgi:uncharacterized protein